VNETVSFSPTSPDKSTGHWCAHCGAAMRFNIPRMGPAGGFVHALTGSLLCGPQPSSAFFYLNPTTVTVESTRAADRGTRYLQGD
jgi:hypothetical protein